MPDTAIKPGPKPRAVPKPAVGATKAKTVAAPATPAPIAPAKPIAKTPAKLVAKAMPIKSAAKAAPIKPVAKKPARSVKVAVPVAAKAVAMPPAPPPAAPEPKNFIAETPAQPAAKDIIMNDTIKTIADKTQAMFGGTSGQAKDAMEKGSKMFEELNAFGKGNIEAVVESSKIAAKGAEDIAKYSAEYARTTVEKVKANAQHFAAVKSPTELFKLQGDLAKEAMEAMMTEGAKFTENYLKLLGQIAQPISNRFAVAAEKVKIAA